MVATANSAGAHMPVVFITPFTTVGARRQNIKHRKPTTNVHRHETKKRFRAFSFSFGSIIAWLYSKVAPAAIIVETDSNEPKTPK